MTRARLFGCNDKSAPYRMRFAAPLVFFRTIHHHFGESIDLSTMTDTKQDAIIMWDSDDDYQPVEKEGEDSKRKADSTLDAPKPKRRQWYQLTNVEKALLMQNAEAVKDFDWSEHCKKGNPPKTQNDGIGTC